MGRVGALTAPRGDQPQLDQPIQEDLEGHTLQVVGDQPGPELREHAEVEAGIGQVQAQTVFPVDTPADRVGGLPIGEVLRELQHRDHRQLSRRNPRLAPDPERVDERPVSEDLTQLVTHPHSQRGFPERRSGHHRGLLRNLRKHTRTHRHHHSPHPRRCRKAQPQSILMGQCSKVTDHNRHAGN
jgi:hypothetical protein